MMRLLHTYSMLQEDSASVAHMLQQAQANPVASLESSRLQDHLHWPVYLTGFLATSPLVPFAHPVPLGLTVAELTPALVGLDAVHAEGAHYLSERFLGAHHTPPGACQKASHTFSGSLLLADIASCYL